MPARRKIVDLEKLRGALTTLCPRRRYRIPPAEIRRPASGQVKCPKCGAISEPDTPTRQTA